MKRVRVKSYEPIAVDPHYRQPWADVWIRFTGRPGRRCYEFAPTLLSYPELELDIRQAREDAGTLEAVSGDVERLERIAAVLPTSRVFVDPNYPDPSYPDIYTAALWIDRQEAQAMLAAFLQVLGFGRVKFAWMKERFIIQPVSIASAPAVATAAELAIAAERAPRK